MFFRFALLLAFLSTLSARAQSTWQATTNKNWETSANWSDGVPNSETAVAEFGASDQPAVNIVGTVTVDHILFTIDSVLYTFFQKGGSNLVFAGDGIVNESAFAPIFDVKANDEGRARLAFTNSATAADAVISVKGTATKPGKIDFLDSASAGSAQISVLSAGAVTFENSATASNAKITIDNAGGNVTFKNTSTAANADIQVKADASLVFSGKSSAGSANILASYAPDRLAPVAPAQITFTGNSTAGNATIDTTRLDFSGNASGGNATFTVRGYTNFRDSSTGGSATFTVKGGQQFSFLDSSSLGNANVILEKGSGINFRSNASGGSGSISGEGWLYKNGAGTVVLSGANTYSGYTEIDGGKFFVNGSLTNTSLVDINEGATLGGSGSIDRAVFIHGGARLEPGSASGVAGTLSFGYALIFANNSTLDFDLGTVSDLIRLTGGWISGPSGEGGITLNLFDSGGFTAGTYTLFDFSAGDIDLKDFDLHDFAFGTTIEDFDYSLGFGENSLTLTATAHAIPEPSTYAALFGVLALGFSVWRKRRAR